MPHPSFLSAWNFVWSQIWKLTLGLGVNLRRVDIITVMVQSTLPGWHTPIKVEIAFDFTKIYASMIPGQTFKWYGNRSDETVAREFRKLVVFPKLVLGLLIVQKTQSQMMSIAQSGHIVCFYSTQPKHFKQDIFQLKHNGYHSLV